GLRVPGGHDALGVERAQRRDARGVAHRGDRLAEHVPGQRVVRDGAAVGEVERAVAVGAPRAQARRGVDARDLGRDADPRVAAAHEVLVSLEPVDLLVPLVRDVVPLGDHGPVERGGVHGSAHDDARAVVVTGAEHRRVGHAVGLVARRLALDEELLLDVAARRQVVVRRKERVAVGGVAERRGHGDRAGHRGVGHRRVRGRDGGGAGREQRSGHGEGERASDGGCGHGISFVGPDLVVGLAQQTTVATGLSSTGVQVVSPDRQKPPRPHARRSCSTRTDRRRATTSAVTATDARPHTTSATTSPAPPAAPGSTTAVRTRSAEPTGSASRRLVSAAGTVATIPVATSSTATSSESARPTFPRSAASAWLSATNTTDASAPTPSSASHPPRLTLSTAARTPPTTRPVTAATPAGSASAARASRPALRVEPRSLAGTGGNATKSASAPSHRASTANSGPVEPVPRSSTPGAATGSATTVERFSRSASVYDGTCSTASPRPCASSVVPSASCPTPPARSPAPVASSSVPVARPAAPVPSAPTPVARPDAPDESAPAPPASCAAPSATWSAPVASCPSPDARSAEPSATPVAPVDACAAPDASACAPCAAWSTPAASA